MSFWPLFYLKTCFILLFYLSWPTICFSLGQPHFLHFISIADVHFDPFIACYKEKTLPCPLMQQLQHAPSSAWENILEKYDITFSQYGLDTSWPLLISALNEAKKISDNKKID